ncbi:MAG: hypothetical protein KY464_01395 [Gemmatimonadetes bacterium]|nr:hypothetical protein [Gemmatimonadota bacterium]
MNRIQRFTMACAALGLLAGTGAAHSQEIDVTAPKQVISANPFGLILNVFNAEYDRVVSQSSTAGFGGSFITEGEEDYLNADVFWRFYPSGRPLNGWAFGAKVGLTNVPDQGTYPGYGFDINRSWILGVNDNFYVGLGFGLKRLIGADDEDFGLEVIPTFRIVNVGYAF